MLTTHRGDGERSKALCGRPLCRDDEAQADSISSSSLVPERSILHQYRLRGLVFFKTQNVCVFNFRAQILAGQQHQHQA